ncbi:unnamed protein product, partial [Phaeothamnion confervicola]
MDAYLVSRLPFWRAFLEGYLLPHEYHGCMAAAATPLLLLASGQCLAAEEPHWVGQLTWAGAWVVLFTAAPLIKWFATYRVDGIMAASLAAAAATLVVACACAFALPPIDGDYQLDNSLAVLNAFLGFPVLVLTAFKVVQMADGADGGTDGGVFSGGGGGRGGRVTTAAVGCLRSASTPLLTVHFLVACAAALWLWQAYVWGGRYVGAALTVAAALAVVGLSVLEDWAMTGDSFVSPRRRAVLRLLIAAGAAVSLALFLAGVAEAFTLSLFFLLGILWKAADAAGIWAELEPDGTLLCAAPWVLPVYSYDFRSDALVDESSAALSVAAALAGGVAWGIVMAVFIEPLSLGIIVACLFLTAAAAAAAAAAANAPVRLATAAQLLNSAAVREASDVARRAFCEELRGVQVVCPEWAAHDAAAASRNGRRSSAGATSAKRGRPSLASLAGVRETAADVAIQLESARGGKGEATGAAANGTAALAPPRPDALYNGWDALAEALVSGRGPLGILGLWGAWYRLASLMAGLARFRGCGRYGADRNWLLRRYDADGQRRDADLSAPPLDAVAALAALPTLDAALHQAFQAEARCMTHFQALVLLAADARWRRESALFRRFLCECQAELAGSGMRPPRPVLRGAGYGAAASVDVCAAAAWLSGLTREERRRFELLRVRFTARQARRDAAADAADAATEARAAAAAAERTCRGAELAARGAEAAATCRRRRADAWALNLSAEDRVRFEQVLRGKWLARREVPVKPGDLALRRGFEEAVLLGGAAEEAAAVARAALEEIEGVGRDCRPGGGNGGGGANGGGGRLLQFVDPDFPPGEASLGRLARADEVAVEWRAAAAVNGAARLCGDGPTPADVRPGILRDGWLLGAMAITIFVGTVSAAAGSPAGAAAGSADGVGGGALVRHESEAGAYAVRLRPVGSPPLTLVVDDFFPALMQMSMGMACAHSSGMWKLWVPLVEKAYAKYLGSYAALEGGGNCGGHVQHVLEDLTGAETEVVLLAAASRGIGEARLWGRILKYRRNGYLLGASTHGDTDAAEKAAMAAEIGLAMGAAYAILDARDAGGRRLVRLGCQPADRPPRDAWQGDWGADSALWTRRLRARLGQPEVEDADISVAGNAGSRSGISSDASGADGFWMSFNDFCVAFRCIYVCRRREHDDGGGGYEGGGGCDMNGRWSKGSVSGAWEMSAERDTAAGLPSSHLATCDVGGNPQFVLRVCRPTDVVLTLTQLGDDPQPAALFMLRPNAWHEPRVPRRVRALRRDNVVASSGAAESSREIRVHAALRPGTYVIMAGCYLPGMEGTFTVTVECNRPAGDWLLASLWPPGDAAAL